MDIEKAKDNFDKDRKPKYFNCNTYRYMVKKCQSQRKNRIQENATNVTKWSTLPKTTEQNKI